jgi:hypothetical protein
MHFPIQDQYAAEVLALIEAGATLAEAIQQAAISNEVPVEAIQKEAA